MDLRAFAFDDDNEKGTPVSQEQETFDDGADEREEDGAVREAIEFVGRIKELSEGFDTLCQERHEMGQAEYGRLTFLGNDVIRMMLEELADTANYCRYQAVKLMLIQDKLEEQLAETLVEPGQEEITIGIKAFKGTKDVGWQGNKR
jgi:hypothetical protein